LVLATRLNASCSIFTYIRDWYEVKDSLLYSCTVQNIYFVNLDEAHRWFEQNQGCSNKPLADFLQTISVQKNQPQDQSFLIACFGREYITADYHTLDHNDRKIDFLCKPVSGIYKESPFVRLSLNKNPDLDDNVWTEMSCFFHKNILYLALSKSIQDYLNSERQLCCLASFMYDPESKVFSKICSLEIKPDNGSLSLQPIDNSPLMCWTTQSSILIKSRGRVFGLCSLHHKKPIFAIYSFLRNKILPISGSKQTNSCIYNLHPNAELIYEIDNGCCIGLYSFLPCQPQMVSAVRVYRVWRYVIS
jgi:hypothetical protein